MYILLRKRRQTTDCFQFHVSKFKNPILDETFSMASVSSLVLSRTKSTRPPHPAGTILFKMSPISRTTLSLFLLLLDVAAGRWTGPQAGLFSPSAFRRLTAIRSDVQENPSQWKYVPRGGATTSQAVVDERTEDDKERYSRQVYTLGARAHGLVRSAKVFVDGPLASGLTYETVKNLALSGIGKIVIVTSPQETKLDDRYHNAKWDDLGKTYIRGARAELGVAEDQEISLSQLLVEFLHRLNPGLRVETIKRDDLVRNSMGSGILLCVDRPFDTQLQLSEVCRKHSLRFVSVETAGVHGRIFSDFGPNFEVHDADGETPVVVPLDKVEIYENETTLLVRAIEGERHDVSKGDIIRFQLPSGDLMDDKFIVTKVMSPEKIIVEPESIASIDVNSFITNVNENAASFSREKQVTQISFVPLKEATERAKDDPSLFTPSDLDKAFDEIRKMAIFECFQALNVFVKKHNSLPVDETVADFCEDVQDDSKDKAWNHHCRTFALGCAAKFVPIQCIFGAIAAQECLKAASGLYNPINQILQYDCDEVLPSEDAYDDAKRSSAESGLAYILGNKVVDSFKSQKLFVVGAGAIGCELLKNLAAMEAGTTKKGAIVVTDMDTIERSNLSRQLLFRDGDISKFKSKAAEEAIRRLNSHVNLQSHTSKVGDDQSGPFDSKFWSKKVDIVLNALDNVDARIYIDGQCVANQKALVDAGTLGSKGNVQVVVPHMSESYASSVDPPDPSIPVCTLKNFPYTISHTIQWGRDLFDGLFVRRPKQANQYAPIATSRTALELENILRKDFGDESAETAAFELIQDFLDAGSPAMVRERALLWAARTARYLFHDSIVKLLEEHPLRSLDEDGEPFWSGSRKPPKAVVFPSHSDDDVDGNLISFVTYAAKLRIESFLGEKTVDSEVSQKEAMAALVSASKGASPSRTSIDIKELLEPIGTVESVSDQYVVEFEKDDESNGHVSFITAASNLRATCYGIPTADVMETRRVAGRIVPAMITTTAFVSALSCIELLKLVQQCPLKRFRNAFINLALPFFAFTAPLPADEMSGLRGQKYTLWDRIVIKESKKVAASGGLTLRHFLKKVGKKASGRTHSIEIASVSYGQYMIYANFLHDDDDKLLDTDLWTVIQESVKSGDDFDSAFSRDARESENISQRLDGSALDLSVIVEDLETGEEVELPPVKVLRSNS